MSLSMENDRTIPELSLLSVINVPTPHQSSHRRCSTGYDGSETVATKVRFSAVNFERFARALREFLAPRLHSRQLLLAHLYSDVLSAVRDAVKQVFLGGRAPGSNNGVFRSGYTWRCNR
jgi:hypothetical protein